MGGKNRQFVTSRSAAKGLSCQTEHNTAPTMKNTRLLPFAVLFLSAQAAAEMPLSLEELLTDKGKLRLETSLNYTNTENEQTRLVAPIYIQTGVNSYIAIPTSLQRGSRNSDIIVGTAGLRYGITGKTEIYGNASYLWRSDRTFADTAHSSRNKNFSDLSAGISHTFMHDGKNPALIGFAEATLYEKSYGKASSGKSWLLGATTYKAIDPVVLSLTGAVRTNRRKNTDAGSLKTGSYLMLNPSVSFAANDRISLSGGVQWIFRQADRLNGAKISARNTATYAALGAGLGINKQTSLSANVRFNVSGSSSATLRLGMQHTF